MSLQSTNQEQHTVHKQKRSHSHKLWNTTEKCCWSTHTLAFLIPQQRHNKTPDVTDWVTLTSELSYISSVMMSDRAGISCPFILAVCPSKCLCPAATVAFVPCPHLPSVKLSLCHNFLLCLASVITVFRSNTADTARSEFDFYPGKSCIKTLP